MLSGDIITEQNIHALDIATWIVDQEPLKAVGSCRHRGRSDADACHGNFDVVFTFPGGAIVSFASKQFGTGFEDIGCRMFGPTGPSTPITAASLTSSAKVVQGGRSPDITQAGAVQNIADFHAAITKGDYANPTVAPSVRSNLTTVLGRTAAYKKAEVTGTR